MSETMSGIIPEITSPEIGLKKLSQTERQKKVQELIKNAEENGLYSYLLSVCRKILKNYRNDAEDMVIITLSKAYRNAGQFKEGNNNKKVQIKTWVHRIATNTCLTFLRRKKVRKEDIEADLPEYPDTPKIENSIRGADPNSTNGKSFPTIFENRNLILELLKSLTQKERELILQKEIEGYKIEELAQKFGLSINTIKTILRRARQKMVKAAKRFSNGTKTNKK